MKANNKTLWIINEYAGSPYHGMEFRHYYLAKELIKKGLNVWIITASYSHLFKSPPNVEKSFQIENIDGINYLWIKVPKYQSSQDKRRVLKWFIFTWKLFFLSEKVGLSKPKWILLSPMQTLPVFPAYFLAKKYDAKLIFEIKDIWPLTLIELGGYSAKNPFIKLLSIAENFAIRKSDLILSVLPGYGNYLKEKKINKDFVYLPNGISLDEMEKIEPLDSKISDIIPKNKFIVGYVGTIGLANTLISFIEAGKILKDYRDIHLLIVGEGSEKNRLMELAKGYENITFISAIPKRQVPSLLRYFYVCYIGLKNQNLFKYGVSPNKIFDYMYSGKPILEAINTSESLVVKANCGLQVEAENPEAIAEGILKFYYMAEKDRKKLGENGRKYALENHTFNNLAEKFLELLKAYG